MQLRKTSLSKQRGGKTSSQRIEYRRLCGLVVPGRDMGPGLPGFSYQPRLWLRWSRAKSLGLRQIDCKTQEREKPQVCAQGLWGKSTFWKLKKKRKKIILLSYNLGVFWVFFSAYCPTRPPWGSNVKPSQSLRVFCVGWIEKPGVLSKVSQPWWVVTSNA